METLTPLLRLVGAPVWRNSEYICALADDDRHLGHTVQTDAWHAYDATKPDSNGGWKYLGQFESLGKAKEAVERSVNETVNRAVAVGSGSNSVQHFWRQ